MIDKPHWPYPKPTAIRAIMVVHKSNSMLTIQQPFIGAYYAPFYLFHKWMKFKLMAIAPGGLQQRRRISLVSCGHKNKSQFSSYKFSRCLQIQLLVRALSLACRWLPARCVLTCRPGGPWPSSLRWKKIILGRKGCWEAVYNDLGTTGVPEGRCTFRIREIHYNRSSYSSTNREWGL